MPVLEAFALGTPVVHSDAPALLELSAEAGIAVPRDDEAGYPERLADAINSILADDQLAQRLQEIKRISAANPRGGATESFELQGTIMPTWNN